MSETFIPLVSKLDDESITIYEKLNSLIIETSSSSYTFPLIKEMGKTKKIEGIEFEHNGITIGNISGQDLALVSDVNTKGLVDSIFSKDIQQYIYIDSLGALTFTENIYSTKFSHTYDDFKLLLTYTQARLLSIFSDVENVTIEFENKPTFNNEATLTNKIRILGDNIMLVLNTQDQNVVNKFPSIRLRSLCENPNETSVTIDKKLLDKALARLMVFDKKFDITVLDYSKINFLADHMELVSVKNKNIEKIPYLTQNNVVEHESIIRFADLVKQLKSITSKNLKISYSDKPAIVLNNESNVLQIVPEVRINDARV